jgi:hypothetical protein
MSENNSLHDQDIHNSNYPALELPEFESSIPEHLLEGVSKDTKFIMENINIQTQYIKWLCEAAIDTNEQVRKTNGRLTKVENWKNKLTNGWTITAAIITVGGSFILIGAKIIKVLSGESLSIF